MKPPPRRQDVPLLPLRVMSRSFFDRLLVMPGPPDALAEHRQACIRRNPLHARLRPVRLLLPVAEQLHDRPPPGHHESLGVCRPLPRGWRGQRMGLHAAVPTPRQTCVIHIRQFPPGFCFVCDLFVPRTRYFKQFGYLTLGGGKLYHPSSATENIGMPFMDWPESWSPERPYFFPRDDPMVTTCAEQGPFPNASGSPPHPHFVWCAMEIDKDDNITFGQQVRDNWRRSSIDLPAFCCISIGRPLDFD